MSKKKKKIFLTSWDIELFRYIHKRKIVLVEQIHRDLPKYISHNSTRYRVYLLKAKGYLKNYHSEDHPKKVALGITNKTFSDFIETNDCIRKELGSGKVEHDLALVDIRYLMSKSDKVLEFLSETEIQSFNTYYRGRTHTPFANIRSDAAIKFQVKDKQYWIAVEYEASNKAKSRYVDLLTSYYGYDVIPAILYICGTKQIRDLVIREEKNIAKKKGFKFYYCILADLKQNESPIFTSQDGKKIKLFSDTS